MQPRERFPYLVAEARAHDPGRYLAALLAPAERRETVLALALLNHELARVPDLVSQPLAGLIRYQWWRDALDEVAAGEAPRQHPVVQALAEAQARGWLEAAALQPLVDARERRLEEAVARDVAALEARARGTDGLVQAETHHVLGGPAGPAREAARDIGTGVGLVGVARDLAAEAGRRGAPPPELARALLDRALARIAAGRAAAKRPPRGELAAFLPGRLAAAEASHLRRLDGDLARAAAARRPARTAIDLLAAWLARRP